MDRTWAVLVARLPLELEDLAVGLLSPGALGTDTAFHAPGSVELRTYFDDVDAARRALDAGATALRERGLHREASGLRVEVVPDARWAERWQERQQPFALGARFTVDPSGAAPPVGGVRATVRLVPGRAFGTGEHATTRLCAAALEAHVVPGSAWLDLGTGTGILALVAAHLGASRVVAVDTDPDAVTVARETFAANLDGRAVDLRLGSVPPGERFDGVVANVAAPFFLATSAEVAEALGAGGILLASGLLVEDLPGVRRALEAAGLAVEEERLEAPWALLVARR